jgi:hypothetical protein
MTTSTEQIEQTKDEGPDLRTHDGVLTFIEELIANNQFAHDKPSPIMLSAVEAVCDLIEGQRRGAKYTHVIKKVRQAYGLR